jgi:hypothetical protein
MLLPIERRSTSPRITPPTTGSTIDGTSVTKAIYNIYVCFAPLVICLPISVKETETCKDIRYTESYCGFMKLKNTNKLIKKHHKVPMVRAKK